MQNNERMQSKEKTKEKKKVDRSFHRLKSAMSGLELLLQCIVFVQLMVFVGICLLHYTGMEFYKCFLVIIPVVLQYAIRKWFDNLPGIILTGGIFIVLSCLIANGYNERFFYIAVVMLVTAYAISVNFSTKAKGAERMPVACVALIIVSYLFGINLHSIVLVQIAMIQLVIFVLVQIVYDNFMKLEQVFEDNREDDYFQGKVLLKVDMAITAILVIVIFFAMMIFYVSPIGNNIFSSIGSGALWLLMNIIYFIFKDAPRAVDIPTETQGETVTGGDPLQELMSEKSSTSDDVPQMDDSLTAFLQVLTMIILMIVIIAFVVALIVLIKKAIEKYRMKKQLGADTIEYIKSTKEFEEQTTDKFDYIENQTETMDRNEKLRKAYKRRAEEKIKGKTRKQSIGRSDMPADITRKHITEDKKDAETITELYEKARYSSQRISEEELQQAEKLYKNHKNDENDETTIKF